MRVLPIVLILWPALCSPALAQAMLAWTPSLSATSPLSIGSSVPVGGTGLPFSATEVASSGVSPMPVSGSGGCAPLVAAASAYGSAATYDGGGLVVGAAAAPTTTAISSPMVDTSGLSGMCGGGTASLAASSRPTVAMAGSASRTGIPLGSIEIGHLGVSSAALLPTLGVALATSPIAAAAPIPPSVSSGVPLVTIAGISSVAAPPVPGLAPGIASKLRR